jgi:hypothetical protein
MLVALLLLAFYWQAATSAAVKSPTFDEEFHIARAYVYTRTGDLRMQQDHPPLVSLLAGLPLLLLPELTAPQDLIGWEGAKLFPFADQLLWRVGNPVDKMVFLARFPIELVGLVLGAFIFRWAREAYGSRAGVVAAGLYAFSPNLLAHTRLVTNDLAATTFVFAALYAYWRVLRNPSRMRLLVSGVAAGLAVSAKLSAMFLIPLLMVLGLVDAFWASAGQAQRGACLVRALLRGALVVTIAALVVWLVHGLEVRRWPGGRITLPATTYLVNVYRLFDHFEIGHVAFLLGEVSKRGWWYYFVIALLLKTPLLTLVLCLSSAVESIRQRSWREESLLYLYPAAYFAFTLFSSINIGYRHILVLVPFLCLFASKVACMRWRLPAPAHKWGLLAVMAAYAATSVWLHPHYLAYFNLIAGGPNGGYRYLVDSNLDWGQDLRLLNEYLEENDIHEGWLGYFGTANPRHYGIELRTIGPYGAYPIADEVAQLDPAPGWYAISATLMQGPYLADPDALDWFRHRQPVAKVGYSIFLYHVLPDPEPPRWLGACYAPDQALSNDEVRLRTGRDDLRIVGFDCRQSWVIPSGAGPGWYLVPTPVEGRASLAAAWLQGTETVFRQRPWSNRTGYTLRRRTKRQALEVSELVQQAWSSPVLSPGVADPVTALPVPLEMEGSVDFLGYGLSSQAAEPGESIEVTTAWVVRQRPAKLNLSHFAHLVDSTGAISVGDALGYPAILWEPGDMFVQRNTLSIPPGAAPGRYWVQVGMYSLITGDRFAVIQDGEPKADRVLLTSVMVGRAGR